MFRVFVLPIVALVAWLLPIRLLPRQLMVGAFLFWLAGGVSLLMAGISRLSDTMAAGMGLMPVLLIALALVVGIAKGRFVLGKTAQKNIDRLQSLPNPQKIFAIYSVKSWVTIEIMLLISASLTWFAVPPFARGVVNLGIGMALLISSLRYLSAIQQNGGCCGTSNKASKV